MSRRDAITTGAVLAIAAWTASLGEVVYSQAREEMITLATIHILLEADRPTARLLAHDFWDGSSENSLRNMEARLAASYCAYPYDREVGAAAASLVDTPDEMLVQFDARPAGILLAVLSSTPHPSAPPKNYLQISCRDWIAVNHASWTEKISIDHACMATAGFVGANHSDSSDFDQTEARAQDGWAKHEECWMAVQAEIHTEPKVDQSARLAANIRESAFGPSKLEPPDQPDRVAVFAPTAVSLYDPAMVEVVDAVDHQTWEAYERRQDGTLRRVGDATEIEVRLWQRAQPFGLQSLAPKDLLAQLGATPERRYEVPVVSATLRASYALSAIVLLTVVPLTLVASLKRRRLSDWPIVGLPIAALVSVIPYLIVVNSVLSFFLASFSLLAGSSAVALRLRFIARGSES